MVNLKIVLLGFYFPASFFIGMISTRHLTIRETVGWAIAISFIGGFCAAYRNTNNLNLMFKSALNTAVLGAVVGLCATYWTDDKPELSWIAIGLSGLLSLGGLASIDWVTKLAKRQAEKRLDK